MPNRTMRQMNLEPPEGQPYYECSAQPAKLQLESDLEYKYFIYLRELRRRHDVEEEEEGGATNAWQGLPTSHHTAAAPAP